MREILFRGRRRDNREWVFGCYYKQSEFYGDKAEGIMIITSGESLCFDQALEYYAVSEETVGQFTGLTDKNGKKIFEGDIVRVYDTHNLKVTFDEGCFYVEDEIVHVPAFTYDIAAYKVIGDIYDNPELPESK